MAKVLYKGHIYESLNKKELEYVYEKFNGALQNFNDAINTLKDGNQKKAVASLEKKTREVFNDKIKGVDYHPKSVEEMRRTADAVDGAMKEQQLSDEQSHSEVKPEARDLSEEKYV